MSDQHSTIPPRVSLSRLSRGPGAVALVLALGVVVAGQSIATSPSTAAGGVSGPVERSAVGGPGPRAERVDQPHTGRTDRRGPAVVVAAGDISQCVGVDCATTRTARLVRAINPYRVLAIGDTQYGRGALSEYRSEYDKTWGQFKARTRPVPGNHEYYTPGASGYYDYFGKLAHRAHGGYYSFNIERWHVVALNSSDGLCSDVGCGPGSRQLHWLKDDLHADKRSCVLAYWHHPPFSSGVPGGNRHVRPMWQALARNGADIVLNGHNHNYERFGPRNADGRFHSGGVRQFIVGTGGTGLRDRVGPWDSLSRERIGDRHGVLKLALRAESYRYKFVTTTGAVIDSGGPISC